MKRIMIVAITLLVGFGTLTVGISQTSQRETKVSGQTSQPAPNVTTAPKGVSRFEVNDWGTLKSLWDSTGRQIYGQEKSANEGYSIVYQVLDSKTGKPKGDLRGIFAIGKTFSERQFDKREMANKKVRLDNIEATCVTLTTADKVLRIDSNYYIDPKYKSLKVIRLINNISKDNVRLVAVRTLHDSGLKPTEQTRFSEVNPKVIKRVDLSQISYANPAAKMPNGLAFGLLDASVFPELPCDFCPPNCFASLAVNPGDVKGSCVECNSEGKLIRDPLANEKCPPGKTAVIVEGWDRLPASIVSQDRWGTICVSCSGTTVEQVTIPGAGGAVPNETVTTYINEGKCQFRFEFDRGNRQSPGDIRPGRTVAQGQGFMP